MVVGFRFSASVLVVALVVASALPAAAQQPPTGSWANEASGENFRYGAGASDGTYLYVFGGYQYGVTYSYPAYYSVLRRYDPVANSWTTLAYMPWGVYYNAGAYHDGNLYSFGGYNTSYGYWNGIMRYTISTNSWTTLGATLTSPRYQLSAATLNNRIYVTGGYYNGYSTVNDEFNPATSSVTARAALLNNQGRYYHASAGVEALGKLYVFGGLLQGQQSSSVHEFTPPTAASPNGSWTTVASMSNGSSPQTRYGCVAAVFNNRVYVTGGYFNGYSTTTLEYSPFTDSWAQRASMANGRYLHGAATVGSKIYVYGGYTAYTSCEEFTPPDFGSPPYAPSAVGQSGSRAESALQAQADPAQFDGWTDNEIAFSADVTDPDAGQLVRFRVQVKPQGASWNQANQVTTLQSSFGPQGPHALTYAIPNDGAYDWRWRVEDAYANSYPVGPADWVEAFGTFASQNTNSPDFRSDQVAPSDPVADGPHNLDIEVDNPVAGPVVLNWTESTDNAPVAGISYEIQVATDGGFNQVEAQLFSTAGTTSFPVTLTVSRFDKYWRLRARDIGGNISNWSQSLKFRVTHDDGFDHGAGDAKKTCGFSAGAFPGLGGAVLGVAILVFAFLRWSSGSRTS
jgi:Kelch motif protein